MDPIQGDQSQGGDPTGGGIFDSYLQAVPEDARDTVTGYLKDAEKHVNERLQSAAELEQQWSPYAGLQMPPPEQLAELLEWSNSTLQSQETFDQWVTQLAEEKGLTKAEAEETADDAETFGLNQDQINQLIDERLGQGTQSLEERLNEMETHQAVELETDAINREIGRIEAEEKVNLTEAQRAQVFKLGMEYSYDSKGNELPAGDTSWVEKGFNDYRSIGTEANRLFVESASYQPAGAMPSGGTPKQAPITDFKEAGAALRERLKQTA